MQLNKDTKNQSELSFLSQEKNDNVLSEVIGHFKIHESFSGLNALKHCGLAVSTGLLIIFCILFEPDSTAMGMRLHPAFCSRIKSSSSILERV